MSNQILHHAGERRRPHARRWPMIAATLAALLALAPTSRATEPTAAQEKRAEPASSVAPGEPASPAPSDPQSLEASQLREQQLLAENGALAAKLQELSSVLQQVSKLVGAEGAPPSETLGKLRSLSQLREQLEGTSRSYAAPLAGDPPRTPELLLHELTRLRAEVVRGTDERDELRARLAEREQALAKAMPEIRRVLDYQREVKWLRGEVVRAKRQLAAGDLSARQRAGLSSPTSGRR